MSAKLVLHFLRSERPPFEVTSRDRITVGRSEECDLNLTSYFAGPLNSVSRRHFELFYEDGHFRIGDMGSTNGTWVGGCRLIEGRPRTLFDGDEIKIANDRNMAITARIIQDRDATQPIPPDPALRAVIEPLKETRDVILLGLAGTGKTTLLSRLIPQPETRDVLDRFFPEHRYLLFCLVNCMEIMYDPSLASLFRLLIDKTQPAGEEWPAEIRRHYDVLSQPGCTLDEIRGAMLETAQTVYKHQGRRIVFMLDQFDDVYDQLPPEAFLILKELKVTEPKVIYVMAMRNEFAMDNPHLHQFLRALNAPFNYWLPPLNDARLKEIVAPYRLGPEEAKMSIKLGGRQPRLTELIARATSEMHLFTRDEIKLISQLLTDTYIADHCREMRNSLLPDEQEALQSVARGVPQMTFRVQSTLTERKWLLTGEEEDLAFASPLFGAYFETLLEEERSAQAGSDKLGLFFDETTSEVVVDGVRIPREDLAPLEERLLKYLYDRAGEACARIDISEHVWEYDPEYAASDDAIARVVSSLRHKLDQASPKAGTRYIQTVRGRGYKLVRQ